MADNLVRMEDHLGSVEEGKLADLVLTKIDPLRQIDALGQAENIRMVWQSGRVMKDLDRLGPDQISPSTLPASVSGAPGR